MEDRRLNVPFLITAVVLVAVIVGFVIFVINTADNFRKDRASIDALGSELSTTIAADVTTLQNQITSTNSQLSTLATSLNTANANLTTLQGQLTASNAQITTLKDGLASANSQIATAQQTLSSLSTLPGQVTSLQNNLNSFGAKTTALENADTTIKSQITALQGTLTTLQTSVSSLTTQVNSLQNQSVNFLAATTVSQAAGASNDVGQYYASVSSGYINISGTTTSSLANIRINRYTSGGTFIDTPYEQNFGTSNYLSFSVTAGYIYHVVLTNNAGTTVTWTNVTGTFTHS